MALCTRCGRQTEGAAEFCSGCGSYAGSREPDQPQAVAAMTGNAGYLRPFTSHGTDGPELAPGPASTAAGRGQYWSLQPASPSGQSPEAGGSGPGDTESAANGLPMPRGPFEPVRPAYPQEQYPPAGSGDYQAAPAYAPDSQPPDREQDPLSGGYSLRAGPAPAGSRPAASYQPAQAYEPPPYEPPYREPAPGGQGQFYADAGERFAAGPAVPAQRPGGAPADSLAEPLEDPRRFASPAGQTPATQAPASQAWADRPGAGQLAADGYAGPDQVSAQFPPGSYAPPGQSPADRYTAPGYTAQSPADRYTAPGYTAQSPAGDYTPPGPTTAQFPAAGYAPAGGPQPAAIVAGPSQASAEAPPAEHAPPGLSPADQPAGAFAPSGPAWLSRGRPAGSAPAAGPPGPKPPGPKPPGRRPPRSETAASRAGLRRRAPEPASAGLPSPDAAPERSRRRQRGAARSGRWIPIAAAAIVLIVCVVSAVILLTQGKPPAKSGAAARSTGSPRQPSPAPASTPTPSRLVTIEPAAAAGPDAPAIAAFLTRYFTAINNHDFATYKQLFSTSLRGGLSRTAFLRGYGSSLDSRATLQDITTASSGELAAAVTFTSHQQPAASPRHTACNVWTISLYLVRQGGGYVIVSPPASYQATVDACS